MSHSMQAVKAQARMGGAMNEVAEYLYEYEEADEALRKLRTGGVPGQLFSGEVCLQEASRDQSNADYWIKRSSAYFVKAWRQEDMSNMTAYTPAATRAALRLAQMPVLVPMLVSGEFADLSTVRQAYKESALIASHVGGLIMRPNAFQKSRTKSDCFGILSEVAVLGLAQRFSVRQTQTDCWQATSTLIASDRGTLRRGYVKDGWDIDIWSKSDEQPPELSYKVQVKSSDRILQCYKKDIEIVSVSPDLALDGMGNGLLALQIVQELNNEQPNSSRGDRITRMLDQRTENLLEAIGDKRNPYPPIPIDSSRSKPANIA